MQAQQQRGKNSAVNGQDVSSAVGEGASARSDENAQNIKNAPRRDKRRRGRGGKGRSSDQSTAQKTQSAALGTETSATQGQTDRTKDQTRDQATNREPDKDQTQGQTQAKSKAKNQSDTSRPDGERHGAERPRREDGRRDQRGPNKRGPQGRGSRTGYHNGSGRPAYAALDLGTNNCRLLVAEPHGQSFRVVDAFSRIVRLGEGLSQSGRLSDEAQDRAISALKVCQSKLSYRSVKRFRLIATEACRRASNGASFLQRVHRETGLKLEIVNRETEARLAVAGCASLVHPEADGVVLFDIGGGSSEIVWLDLDPLAEDAVPQPGEKRNRQTRRAMRHMSERIRCWTSLQVGVVTLSEKHGGHLVTPDHFEAMVGEVRAMLHDFEEREALTEAIQSKHIHMLGTSGTVTTLAGVHLGLERYDRRQVDGAWLTADELRGMISTILNMDFDERTNNPCIGQDRADLVLAGCAILEAFHREWPCSRLRVADRGLREGILTELMIDDGVWTQPQSKKKNQRNKRSRRRGGRSHRGQGPSEPGNRGDGDNQ